MGILHFFNIVKKGHYLDVVLFCVLFVWVGKLSYDKIENETQKSLELHAASALLWKFYR